MPRHERNNLRLTFPNMDESVVDVDRVIGWLQNFQVNLKTIGFKSVSDLPKIEGSALVIDKSMASTQFFKQLPAIKNYKGTLIVCDRALYHTIKYNASGYVCNLDSSPICLSFFDRPDVKKVMKKITAIFAVTTNPLTIRHWHGARYFFTPYMMGLTNTLMQKSGTPNIRTGGQVACFAWILAKVLGANPIGTFGITHSCDDITETEYPSLDHVRINGPHGLCWQDAVYRFYNDTFLQCIKQGKEFGVKTVNCSKSGLLYSGDVVDMSLKQFVNKYG